MTAHHHDHSRSSHCLTRFEANPAQFLDDATSGGVAIAGEYTCPMHPEVVRAGPGTCPICGMALEPRLSTDAEDETELHAMRRRFWISLALTLPVFLLAMSEMLPGMPVQHAL